MTDGDLTIAAMAKRSNFAVYGMTSFLAIAGSLLVICLGGQAIWGVWIPFCSITIPPIHYLCREVVTLRRKLEEIEKRLGE